MDKDESGKQEEVKSAETLDTLPLPVAQEYVEIVKDLLMRIEGSRVAALSAIGEDTKSLFSNKKMLSYILNLVELSHVMARTTIVSTFAVDYVNRKMNAIEKAVSTLIDSVQFLLGETKRLPTEADLKTLRNLSKQLTDIDVTMQNVKFIVEKEKGIAEAFKKIDKNRQEILRDTVV